MIIVTAVKCLCIIFYSGNIPNYDNCNCCKIAYVLYFIVVIYQIMIIVAAVKCLCIIFYSGNIPNYDNCSCCKMPMYYIL